MEVFVSSWRDAADPELQAEWNQAAARRRLESVRGLVGDEAIRFKVYVGPDGFVAPEPHPFQVGFWLFDRATGKLYTPETLETRWAMEEGRLPVYVISWGMDGLEVATTVFAQWNPAQQQLVTFARTVVQNGTDRARTLDGYIVVRPSPFAADPAAGGCRVVEFDGRNAVSVDGRRSIWVSGPRGGAVGCGGALWSGVVPLSAAGRVECEGHAAEVAVVFPQEVEPGATVSWEIRVASGEAAMDAGRLDVVDRESCLNEVRARWRARVPMKLDLPDRQYADFFYSSLHYLLLLKTGDELRPGPRQYASFYLHDGVDMVEALDKAGLHDVARECLRPFHFKEGDGYLDAIGGCAYALYAHYLLTRDRNYLAEVYARILENGRRIQSLRNKHLAELPAGSEFRGLLPTSVSQDNFTKPAHLYLDDWWSLVGLKAGISAAKELGEPGDVAWLQAEYDDLRAALWRSIDRVMAREGVPFMPAFADHWPASERAIDHDHRLLGGTQIAWAHRPAVCPGEALGVDIPRDLFRKSYQHYWRDANRLSAYDGAWFVEYEKVFWGYNVLLARPMVCLGLREIALRNIEWSLKHPSCPGAWMEAMKSRPNSEGLYELDEGIVGDVPHGWTAAHYVLLLRDMLIREQGDQLALLACVPDTWLAPGQKIEVLHAPTFFGTLDLRAEAVADGSSIVIDLATTTPPPGGYRLSLPRTGGIARVRINGEERAGVAGSELLLPPDAQHVDVEYARNVSSRTCGCREETLSTCACAVVHVAT